MCATPHCTTNTMYIYSTSSTQTNLQEMKKKVISYSDKDYFFPLLPPAASSAITWCCCAALQSWFGWLQSNCCEHVTFCQTSTTMLILWPRFCGVVVCETDLIRFCCVLNLWPARGCFDCARPSDYPHTVWHSVWHNVTQCDEQSMRQKDCQMVRLLCRLISTQHIVGK